MKIYHPRVRCLLSLFVGTLGLFGLMHVWSGQAPHAARASSKQDEEAAHLPPAAQLVLRAGEYKGQRAELLDLGATAWDRAKPSQIVLNRTPRVYQTESVQRRSPPTLEVRGFRSESKLILRLRWADETKDAPKAPPRKTGEGGDPAQLYKQPTGETAAFPDAAAVMFPERWTGKEFPSLVMGDRHSPARIWYWNASRGAKELSSTGRATQHASGKEFAHRAKHTGGHWSVTMELPEMPDGYPIAFAIWDGHAGDRDGLKFFSIWYVLKWQ